MIFSRHIGNNAIKYVIAMGDEAMVEAVLIKHVDHISFCVSSQLGCRQACAFCEAGRQGFIRNLTASEICQQVSLLASEASLSREDALEIGFMGIGEPLDNLAELAQTVRQIRHEFTHCDIVVSTVGLIPGIQSLPDLIDKARLQVSVHAVEPKKRYAIMPVERRFPIVKVLEAASLYRKRTGLVITINCVLLDGINDSEEDAMKLGEVLDRFEPGTFRVKVSGYNQTGSPFRASDSERIDSFTEVLKSSGQDVVVFRSKGTDVAGGCGQLAYAARHRK
jgi:23S rRNA (adenine2503-C2)-methyltransferase